MTINIVAPPNQKGLVLNNDDVLDVNAGGRAENTTINSGGIENVSTGGLAVNTLVFSGGTLNVGNATATGFGEARHTTINAGGVENVNKFGLADYTTINSGGVEIVNAMGGKANANHTTVNKGGLLDIVSGSTSFTTVNDGGVATIAAGNIKSATINSGGTLDAKAGVSVDGLTFGAVVKGVGGLLKLGDPANLHTTAQAPINNWFRGDTIDLANTTVTSVTERHEGRIDDVTVTYGNNQTVTYALARQEHRTHVDFQSDGHGGTNLILVVGVPPNEVHHLL
jgi:autotransporter passenger strand-loop-strand repeat protein